MDRITSLIHEDDNPTEIVGYTWEYDAASRIIAHTRWGKGDGSCFGLIFVGYRLLSGLAGAGEGPTD